MAGGVALRANDKQRWTEGGVGEKNGTLSPVLFARTPAVHHRSLQAGGYPNIPPPIGASRCGMGDGAESSCAIRLARPQ